MNTSQEEQVPLDDFVDYTQEYTIPRLPETKIGQKLKIHLKKHKNYKDIYNMKNYMSLDDEERKIVEAVETVFKEAEELESTSHTDSIDCIFSILENILNYPYEDEHRILYLDNFPDSKVLQLISTHKLLELIGFENGSKPTIFVLPHDKELSKVLLALETFVSKISMKIEVS